MSSAVLDFVAGIILAAIFFTSTASCGMVPAESQRPTTSSSPEVATTSQKRGEKDGRVAIPDIKGCQRDQTSFYKGKVLSFKRQQSSVEITLRTEWDTTEKLKQPNIDNSIAFRLKGQPMKDEDWKQIESHLSDPSHTISATVWVCGKAQLRNQIKIIDWQPPASR